MPLIHERTFRIRHYECDVHGHLNNANYLRLMQEAAFNASAAAGYDFDRYRSMGQTWLIRATDIEYLQPVGYNDRVTVRTWVADFWRTHSTRAYEFRPAGTGEVIAQGMTDWAYLETESGRPAVTPLPLVQAFFPEGPPATPGLRRRIPAASPPPVQPFTLHTRVAWRDLDENGHVNNANYLSLAEDCGVQVLSAFGWSMDRCAQAGFAIIVRRHQVQYRQPAMLDDELDISTWVSDPQHASALRHYLIRRAADGTLLARLRSRYVWVDLETRRPIRIPPDFLADFAPNIH